MKSDVLEILHERFENVIARFQRIEEMDEKERLELIKELKDLTIMFDTQLKAIEKIRAKLGEK